MNKEMTMQGLAVSAVIFLFGFLGGCAESQDPAVDTTFTTIEDYILQSHDVEAPPETVDYSALVQANNALAIQFFHYANNGNTTSATNGLTSSFGFSQTLAMVASGARGTTAAEFPLGHNVSADPVAWSEKLYALNQQIENEPSSFVLHNAAWGQERYRFLSEYLSTLNFRFGADLKAYPFKPVSDSQPEPILILIPDFGGGNYAPTGSYWSSMDNWAAEMMAPDVLQAYSVAQNDPDRTRLAFTNTTNLVAGWPMALTPADSFEGLFETFDGIQHWVPMLRQQGMFNYYEDVSLSAVELPLGTGEQSLLLITPSAANYQTVFNNLAQHISDISAASQPTDMEVFLPEFTFLDEGKLNSFLDSLGFDEVYWDDYVGCTESCGPDFSGINGQGFLRLETMTRRARLNFSSEAVNAASITSAVLESTRSEPASVWDISPGPGWGSGVIITGPGVCFDITYVPEGQAHAQPFIFVIRDTQTKAILYIGQLTDAGGSEAGSWVCP